MRRLFFVLALVAGVALSSQAQEVGVRFGGMSGHGGVAVDGVFGVGQFSRIHADVGFFNDGFAAEALWDFLYRPLGGEAFNWYVGAGPSMAVWSSTFLLGASGEAGLEYRFGTVPLAIGVDWRPTFWIVEDTDFDFNGFGLNVRWVFGGGSKE
ncbi:hypothetical protein J1N10_01815 [Carboxylicivirga sp. A043]|uniref:hypothetical protein n=1 Tax=Carboxylicivirga litoralis TaxID=2816963 RepID=UPI0021CAE9BE|nr:hypothetical protein [Carboxylicivirga sp. A043]MCU4154692.1 hypothetical protein [Carboxylicivirga sp. A043]